MRQSLLLAVLLLSACGIEVPPEKASYVGQWSGPQMTLSITQDGRVEYERKNGSASTSTSIKGPLKKFVGDSFVVGVGPLETTFEVAAAPHLDAAGWKMTVDGVELLRPGEPGQGALQ